MDSRNDGSSVKSWRDCRSTFPPKTYPECFRGSFLPVHRKKKERKLEDESYTEIDDVGVIVSDLVVLLFRVWILTTRSLELPGTQRLLRHLGGLIKT